MMRDSLVPIIPRRVRVGGVVGGGQRFLRRQLQMPALRAQVLQHLASVLHRQFALERQLHLHHEAQFTQHQRQRLGQYVERVAFGQPQVSVSLGQAGVDEALHGSTVGAGASAGEARVAAPAGGSAGGFVCRAEFTC